MGKARAGEWSLCSGAAAYWTKVHLGSGWSRTRFEWDAEIINDKPYELIAWRTVGSRVDHAGSVHFDARPEGGTMLRVSLQYA